MVQLIILDDNTFFRIGIKYAFEGSPDIHVAAEKCRDAAFFGLLERTPADVVLLGVNNPNDTDCLTIARQIRRDFPAVKILAVVEKNTICVVQSLMEAGINGYIGVGQANREELEKAIRKVAVGEKYYGTIDCYKNGVESDQLENNI